MENNEFVEYMEVICEYDDFDMYKAISSKSILKAEDLLGFKIMGDYLYFLKNYGTVSINGEEIYGITDDDFLNSSIPNGIWLTLQERKDMNLPNNLLIIADDYFGGYVCLDYANLNAFNEPNVVIYNSGMIGPYDSKIKHFTFFDFLKTNICEE